jgi:hypothetical protein
MKLDHINPNQESLLFPGINFKVSPEVNGKKTRVNPKKIEDGKRLIKNLKGPLPWDPNNPY